jgi:hypothetical protein
MDFNQLSKGGKKSQEDFSRMVANESAARLMTRRTLERLKVIALGEWKPELVAEAEVKAEDSEAGSDAQPEANAE